MSTAYPHRIHTVIIATLVGIAALAMLVPMYLAYLTSGNRSPNVRDGIWLFTKCWAAFFSGAPVVAWILWCFSKRAAFQVAVVILAAAALPILILTGWVIVAQVATWMVGLG